MELLESINRLTTEISGLRQDLKSNKVTSEVSEDKDILITEQEARKLLARNGRNMDSRKFKEQFGDKFAIYQATPTSRIQYYLHEVMAMRKKLIDAGRIKTGGVPVP